MCRYRQSPVKVQQITSLQTQAAHTHRSRDWSLYESCFHITWSTSQNNNADLLVDSGNADCDATMLQLLHPVTMRRLASVHLSIFSHSSNSHSIDLSRLLVLTLFHVVVQQQQVPAIWLHSIAVPFPLPYTKFVYGNGNVFNTGYLSLGNCSGGMSARCIAHSKVH